MSRATAEQRVLALANQMSVIRSRDVADLGITPGTVLHRLVQKGELERVGRGLYELPNNAAITEHHTLVEVAKRVPNGVFCLLSALYFHDLGTQLPYYAWLAIERNAPWPRLAYPRTRIFRISGPAFEAGIEHHVLEGVPVRVYGPAKTVVDCFKYRNKVGIDVAVEALQDYVRKQPIADLWAPSQACRMTRVMRPYIEAMI